MLRDEVINMPWGTRLYAVVTHGDEVHVWIAVARRSENYDEWRGTFINFERNGRVTRVTVDDNYPTDDIMVIREGEEK
jgi:hypothetical protein